MKLLTTLYSHKPHHFRHLPLLLALLVSVGICIIVAYSQPGESFWLPACLFHKLTGLYCPGCGSTRALHALLHGNVLQSLDYNPLLIPHIGLILYLIDNPKAASNPRFSRAVFYIFIIFLILRNIPLYPFTILAP